MSQDQKKKSPGIQQITWVSSFLLAASQIYSFITAKFSFHLLSSCLVGQKSTRTELLSFPFVCFLDHTHWVSGLTQVCSEITPCDHSLLRVPYLVPGMDSKSATQGLPLYYLFNPSVNYLEYQKAKIEASANELILNP